MVRGSIRYNSVIGLFIQPADPFWVCEGITTQLTLDRPFFFFKQKTAYEISVRDWSSDVCSSDLNSILAYLRTVEAERRRRSGAPDLAVRVHALKAYQQQRFSFSYDDLLKTHRHGPAARFFLDELYGPSDS